MWITGVPWGKYINTYRHLGDNVGEKWFQICKGFGWSYLGQRSTEKKCLQVKRVNQDAENCSPNSLRTELTPKKYDLLKGKKKDVNWGTIPKKGKNFIIFCEINCK